MKSVLLLLPGAFSGVGGIEMYNRQLIRAFLELGGEQSFQVRTLVMNDRTADVDDRYVPRGALSPRGFSRRGWAFGASALWESIRARPDVIVFGHVHFASLAPVFRILSPRSRHWHLVHGIEVWSPLSSAIRRGLALADLVLSVSAYSRNELEKNGGVPPERIRLLPCSLDSVWQAQYSPRPAWSGAPHHSRPTLLTVARLSAAERYKGVDSVVRALPEVVKAVPDVLYDVVGEGDDMPRLEALARDLGVADHVRFHGRQWPDQLAAAYRVCTLFVMPSSHEGFGIVFLEAALFGKTSVAGRHGGSPEVVEDGVTGLLVEREDVPGLAIALVRLLTDERERERMGDAARRRLSERFTYGTFREKLRAYIDASGAPTVPSAVSSGSPGEYIRSVAEGSND